MTNCPSATWHCRFLSSEEHVSSIDVVRLWFYQLLRARGHKMVWITSAGHAPWA